MCFGQCSVVVALEYGTRRVNRRPHAAFTVDGMNEADLPVRISCKVPVKKSSMWAIRAFLVQETDLGWVAVNGPWRCLARTLTETVMKAKSKGSSSYTNGRSGMRWAGGEDTVLLRSRALRSTAVLALHDLSRAARAFASARSATCLLYTSPSPRD